MSKMTPGDITTDKMKTDKKTEFIPFGPEWEEALMKLPKTFLIQQLKSALMNSKDLNPTNHDPNNNLPHRPL